MLSSQPLPALRTTVWVLEPLESSIHWMSFVPPSEANMISLIVTSALPRVGGVPGVVGGGGGWSDRKLCAGKALLRFGPHLRPPLLPP